MTPKKEKIIIDMRQSDKNDLIELSKILININNAVLSHNLKLQIKKSRYNHNAINSSKFSIST